MNNAHWHLALNHLPIIIPIVGLCVMIGGFILKSEILKRAAYFIFIVAALTAIIAYLTGDGAEEIVEKINGKDKQFIKTHEEAAEIFALLIYILGGISLLGLWASWKEKSVSKIISFGTIGFTLIVLFSAKQTANTGGEIRHVEIRTTAIDSNTTINKSIELDDDD